MRLAAHWAAEKDQGRAHEEGLVPWSDPDDQLTPAISATAGLIADYFEDGEALGDGVADADGPAEVEGVGVLVDFPLSAVTSASAATAS